MVAGYGTGKSFNLDGGGDPQDATRIRMFDLDKYT